MAASITNLPTELVEMIAAELELKDIYSLRLARSVFPTRTRNALQQKHDCDAIYTIRDDRSPWDFDGTRLGDESDAGKNKVGRLHRWHDGLREIAIHPLYSSWLSSVWITDRRVHASDREESEILFPDGLGEALSKLPNLATLWLGWDQCRHSHAVSQKAINQVLSDLVNATGVPPLQNVVMVGFESTAELLCAIVEKHKTTLKEVTFLEMMLPAFAGWQAVIKALAGCKLGYFDLHPWSDGGVFRGKNKYDISAECSNVEVAFHDYYLETYRIKGEEKCARALAWLAESNLARSFLQYGCGEPGSSEYAMRREVYEDLDVEMKYRKRYRAALKGYEQWSLQANGLAYALSKFSNLTTLWLGWSLGDAGKYPRTRGYLEMNSMLVDLVLASTTPPIRHLVLSGFSSESDNISAVVRKFRSSLREVAFFEVVITESRMWKQVFKALQSCELEYLFFFTNTWKFSLRGDDKHQVDLDFMEWEQEPLTLAERFTAVGQDACTSALAWLVQSNVMRRIRQNGRCEPGNGTETIEQEVFEDLDVVLAYHQRYRAALKSGVTLPGEDSYHWWYQAKYDDDVRAGWFWQIQYGEIKEVEKLTEREVSFGRYRDGHPDSPLADLCLPGRYDPGED